MYSAASVGLGEPAKRDLLDLERRDLDDLLDLDDLDDLLDLERRDLDDLLDLERRDLLDLERLELDLAIYYMLTKSVRVLRVKGVHKKKEH